MLPISKLQEMIRKSFLVNYLIVFISLYDRVRQGGVLNLMKNGLF